MAEPPAMTTTSFESNIRSAIANNERAIFIQQVRDTPDLTLGEVAELAKGDLGHLVNSVTIGEILNPELAQKVEEIKDKVATHTSSAERKKVGATPATEKAALSTSVDVRTPQGRAVYDAAVVAALKQLGANGKGDNVAAAPAVRKIVGGTAEQLRASLNRVVGDGKVLFDGRARGTRYWIAP